jgi:hypothetical protein
MSNRARLSLAGSLMSLSPQGRAPSA